MKPNCLHCGHPASWHTSHGNCVGEGCKCPGYEAGCECATGPWREMKDVPRDGALILAHYKTVYDEPQLIRFDEGEWFRSADNVRMPEPDAWAEIRKPKEV